MLNVKGKLTILNDNKTREITISNGVITGDEVFKFELMFVAASCLKKGVFPFGYMPETRDYLKDDLALCLVLQSICKDLVLEGDVPQLPELPEGYDA